MPAILSPHPKRIREFMHNGQIYEGGIEEALSGNTPKYELGGIGESDSLSKAARGETEEEK